MDEAGLDELFAAERAARWEMACHYSSLAEGADTALAGPTVAELQQAVRRARVNMDREPDFGGDYAGEARAKAALAAAESALAVYLAAHPEAA